MRTRSSNGSAVPLVDSDVVKRGQPRWSGSPFVLGRLKPRRFCSLSRQLRDTTAHHKGEPLNVVARPDDHITAHRGTAGSARRRGPHRDRAPREKATPIIMEMMRSVYPHDQVFGEFCTVNSYIDCPPDELFDYMADTRCPEEWTYSLRGVHPNRGARTVARL